MALQNRNPISISEKAIETPYLQIRKNIMKWNNTFIQLSNISFISASNMAPMRLPFLFPILFLLGLIIMEDATPPAMLFLIVGAAGLIYWLAENKKRKNQAVLTIRMNSGHNLYFTFDERNFLFEVIGVLESIIVDGGKDITISLKDCTISNDSHVLNNLQI